MPTKEGCEGCYYKSDRHTLALNNRRDIPLSRHMSGLRDREEEEIGDGDIIIWPDGGFIGATYRDTYHLVKYEDNEFNLYGIDIRGDFKPVPSKNLLTKELVDSVSLKIIFHADQIKAVFKHIKDRAND